MKAPYTLSVSAPNDWVVISTEPTASKVPEHNNEQTVWNFDSTNPLSTYLFTVIAGPYREIVASEDQIYKGLTQSLYCRETLYEYAVKQQHDIFEYNADALRRFEELFGYNYPFKKIDSIFCPEYSIGAMENPGAVTYTEQYLYKKVPTTIEINNRGSTIVHELAHMWFGNTVTMKWWNDLWLNESFADFVNYVVMADQHNNMSFETIEGWMMFNQRKGWGYRADQMENTHAIYSDVKDVAAADSIFDGITYSKGAATMRQLYALIGRETFTESMKRYFNRNQFDNATLDDLLDVMQEVLTEKNGSGEVPEHLNL